MNFLMEIFCKRQILFALVRILSFPIKRILLNNYEAFNYFIAFLNECRGIIFLNYICLYAHL